MTETATLTLTGSNLVDVLYVLAASDIDLALYLAAQAGITDAATLAHIEGK